MEPTTEELLQKILICGQALIVLGSVSLVGLGGIMGVLLWRIVLIGVQRPTFLLGESERGE